MNDRISLIRSVRLNIDIPFPVPVSLPRFPFRVFDLGTQRRTENGERERFVQTRRPGASFTAAGWPLLPFAIQSAAMVPTTGAHVIPCPPFRQPSTSLQGGDRGQSQRDRRVRTCACRTRRGPLGATARDPGSQFCSFSRYAFPVPNDRLFLLLGITFTVSHPLMSNPPLSGRK